ncbi:MAG: hypothetical protein K8J08_11820, partial [Thermoanaerobaculia bacterium]|nr:hypothetical protein [Thermoanaerobaculia bacterium]
CRTVRGGKPPLSVKAISVRGNGGQAIFVVAEFYLVAVFIDGYYNSDGTRLVYDILYNAVLKTLVS